MGASDALAPPLPAPPPAGSPRRRIRRWLWLLAAVVLARAALWGWTGLISSRAKREALNRWSTGWLRGADAQARGLSISVDWLGRGRLSLRDISVEHPHHEMALASLPWPRWLDIPRLDARLPLWRLYGLGAAVPDLALPQGGRAVFLRDARSEWNLGGLEGPALPRTGAAPFPFGHGRLRVGGARARAAATEIILRDQPAELTLQGFFPWQAAWRTDFPGRHDASLSLSPGSWRLLRGADPDTAPVAVSEPAFLESGNLHFGWRVDAGGRSALESAVAAARLREAPIDAGRFLGLGWPRVNPAIVFTGQADARWLPPAAPDSPIRQVWPEPPRSEIRLTGDLSGWPRAFAPFANLAAPAPVAARWQARLGGGVFYARLGSAPPGPREAPMPDGGTIWASFGAERDSEAEGGDEDIADSDAWQILGSTGMGGRVAAAVLKAPSLAWPRLPRDLAQPPDWLAWIYRQGGDFTLTAPAAVFENIPVTDLAATFRHAGAGEAAFAPEERADGDGWRRIRDALASATPRPAGLPPADRFTHVRADAAFLGASIRFDAGPWKPGMPETAYRLEADGLAVMPIELAFGGRMPGVLRPRVRGGEMRVRLTRHLPASPPRLAGEEPRHAAGDGRLAAPPRLTREERLSAEREVAEWEVSVDFRDLVIDTASDGLWRMLASTAAGLAEADRMVRRAGEGVPAGLDSPEGESAVPPAPLPALHFPSLAFSFRREANGVDRMAINGQCLELGTVSGLAVRSSDNALSGQWRFTDVPPERWRESGGLSEATRESARRLGEAGGSGWRFSVIHARHGPTRLEPVYIEEIVRGAMAAVPE